MYLTRMALITTCRTGSASHWPATSEAPEIEVLNDLVKSAGVEEYELVGVTINNSILAQHRS